LIRLNSKRRGLPPEQVDAIKEASGEVATKRDTEHLEVRIAKMKFDLLKWIVGMSLAQFSALIGILLKITA